jgi:hypothetical protein
MVDNVGGRKENTKKLWWITVLKKYRKEKFPIIDRNLSCTLKFSAKYNLSRKKRGVARNWESRLW